MWILIVEAVLAFLILVSIVWWTMFSGRRADQPSAHEGGAEDREPPRDGVTDAARSGPPAGVPGSLPARTGTDAAEAGQADGQTRR
jgi:nitrogen fixation-related uncharacterized protein